MSDIVERLLDYSKDDHERGCQGRYYDCSCGYDAQRDPLLVEAAKTIESLRDHLAKANMEVDRLTRTNQAKREHRDKLLQEVAALKAAITIPPAALEAGAISLRGGWGEADEAEKTAYLDAARAAFVAMVEHWPMWTTGEISAPGGDLPALILPLTEKQDDKA